MYCAYPPERSPGPTESCLDGEGDGYTVLSCHVSRFRCVISLPRQHIATAASVKKLARPEVGRGAEVDVVDVEQQHMETPS